MWRWRGSEEKMPSEHENVQHSPALSLAHPGISSIHSYPAQCLQMIPWHHAHKRLHKGGLVKQRVVLPALTGPRTITYVHYLPPPSSVLEFSHPQPEPWSGEATQTSIPAKLYLWVAIPLSGHSCCIYPFAIITGCGSNKKRSLINLSSSWHSSTTSLCRNNLVPYDNQGLLSPPLPFVAISLAQRAQNEQVIILASDP